MTFRRLRAFIAGNQPEDEHITVRAIVPVVAALKALGHDASAMLRACGIDALVLDAADGRVAHSAMMRLWQQAQIETGDVYLGLHLAQAAPLESFELHAYAVMANACHPTSDAPCGVPIGRYLELTISREPPTHVADRMVCAEHAAIVLETLDRRDENAR